MMTGEACTFGMVGMGLISLLLIVALVLGVGALARYLFAGNRAEEGAQKHADNNYERHVTK
ncbi:hypothetical protein [Marinobacter sp.]|uniref:hypothetical protein n=1 Tax=Marinobacter sp. TaxID=50741 RepID=UPI00384DFC52